MVTTSITLLDLLANDLIDWMGRAPDDVPRRVLLWLDPDRQFSRLVAPLEPILQKLGTGLMRYAPEAGSGQFAIKLALLRLESMGEGRAIVYLPSFTRQALEPDPDTEAPGLWALYDYRYKGCIWGLGELWEPGAILDIPTILGWLRRHGIIFADDKTAQTLSTGGSESLLARYAERQCNYSLDTWPRPVRYSDVEEALAGNPRDTLRRLLAAPNNEVKQWDDRALVLERITAEYGLASSEGESTPEQLADTFAIQIALTEAWDAFSRPNDFPFLTRLPKKTEHRDRLVLFLREEIIPHTELCPRFLKRLERLETQYDLEQWATNRSGQPAGLPRLARTMWHHFLERFDQAAEKNWKEAAVMLLAERETLSDASSGPWDKTEKGIRWWLPHDLASLVEQAREAITEAQSSKTCADLVKIYVSKWWQLDWLHLRIRAACSNQAGLEKVRQVADLAYFDYVSQSNQRFTDLVEQEKVWPLRNTTGVESLRKSLWPAGKGRRAVLVIDALRWDLGINLKERLGEDCTLEPILATIPTKTHFGMATMLPLDIDHVIVDFTASGPDIRQGKSDNLAEREGRKRFLQAELSSKSARARVHFIDLEALLQCSAVPDVPLVVVMDNAIDQQGEKGTEELPALVDQFLTKLQRAIERLHTAGIGIVHVVTDHGFLLLPAYAVDALGRPELPITCTYVREERWAALKPDAPPVDVFRIALPLAGAHTLGFPRGVRTLMKASSYLHGGISLQECVIPHLESRVSVPQARLGVDVRVTSNRLSGGTVPVVLRPILPEIQAPLGGFTPLTVRLWVETEQGDAATRQVTEPIDILVRPDVEELRPAVYLQEDLGLAVGQELVLRVIVKETGEELSNVHLTLLVDWE